MVRRLTPEDKFKIESLTSEGYSSSQIGNIINKTSSAVRKYLCRKKAALAKESSTNQAHGAVFTPQIPSIEARHGLSSGNMSKLPILQSDDDDSDDESQGGEILIVKTEFSSYGLQASPVLLPPSATVAAAATAVAVGGSGADVGSPKKRGRPKKAGPAIVSK
jgi:hypothetical protein